MKALVFSENEALSSFLPPQPPTALFNTLQLPPSQFSFRPFLLPSLLPSPPSRPPLPLFPFPLLPQEVFNLRVSGARMKEIARVSVSNYTER